MTDDWLEISFTSDGDRAEFASEILSAFDASAVTTCADGDEPAWLDLAEPVRPAWQRVKITGLFTADTDPAPILAQLLTEGLISVPDDVVCSTLAGRVWEREWMDQFQPLKVSASLWIVPTHCEKPAEAETAIYLDPGLAFGTGTHPTTALCLAAIASMELTGETVLDYGCGSGILAIAALKCGAAQAIGVDVDPRALQASTENARINGVETQYSAYVPTQLSTAYRATLVIANILADTLKELSDALVGHVDKSGRLLLSGILTHQAAEVVQHFGSGWRFEQTTEDGWVLLTGERLVRQDD